MTALWLLLIWHIGCARPEISSYTDLRACERVMLAEIASHQAIRVACERAA